MPAPARLGREAIYATFFSILSAALLTPAGPFNYTGRRPIGLGALPPEQYPAFVFIEEGERYDRSSLMAPARVTMFAKGIIQSLHGVIPDESAPTWINNLADTVESAIEQICGPTAQNTLMGLVQQAWLNHRQVTVTPSWGNRWAECILEIEMVLPHSR